MKLFGGMSIATEQLEIEKLLESDQNSGSATNFSTLFTEVKQKIDNEVANKEYGPASTTDTSSFGSDSSDDDSGDDDLDNGFELNDDGELTGDPDSEGEDDGDPEDDSEDGDDEDGEEKNVSAESFRHKPISFVYFREDDGIATESWFGDERGGDSKLASAARYLGVIGFQFGSYLLKNAYKGVIYLFGKLSSGIVDSVKGIDKYLERREMSISKLRASIEEARKVIALLKEEGGELNDLTDMKFTKAKIINQIKSGSSIDIGKNIDALTGWMERTISGIGEGVKQDMQSLSYAVETARYSKSISPTKLLSTDKVFPDMEERDIQGYEAPNEYVKVYVGNANLPGDVVLINYVPNVNSDDVELYASAYRSSALFIGVDTAKFRSVPALNYMALDGVSHLLDKLDGLCTRIESHESFYKSVRESKLGTRFLFRGYLDSLTKRGAKVSLKSSLIELVYLKNAYIDRVYLPAAIDVHDYASRVALAALSYVEANLKALK